MRYAWNVYRLYVTHMPQDYQTTPALARRYALRRALWDQLDAWFYRLFGWLNPGTPYHWLQERERRTAGANSGAHSRVPGAHSPVAARDQTPETGHA